MNNGWQIHSEMFGALKLLTGEVLADRWSFVSHGMACAYPGFVNTAGTFVPLHAVLVAVNQEEAP